MGLTVEPATLQPTFSPSVQEYAALCSFPEGQENTLTINVTPSEDVNIKIYTQQWIRDDWRDVGVIENGTTFNFDDVGKLRIVCTKDGYQQMQYKVQPIVVH